jgi:phage terminase large subunit-like protein
LSDGLVVPDHLKNDPEVLRDLNELNTILEENPLEGYNNPALARMRFAWAPDQPIGRYHKKQMEFHAFVAPELGVKLLLASNRAGKTVACTVDDIIQLVDEQFVPEHLKAFKKWFVPIEIWVGAPKNENHFKNSIKLFKKFLPKHALVEGQWSKSFRSQPTPTLTLANGSVVSFKTYDQDVDAWASAEVHRIHWDEEPNGTNGRDLRTEARFRLASTGGDEIIGMTPVLGADSWVNDEVYEQREDPSIFVVKMKIEDNPWNTPEIIKELTKGLTKDEYRARINAEFVQLGGLFYPEFDEERHVIDPIEPDHLEGQEVVIGIDPGRERTGVVWVSFDGENRGLVFDEFFPGQTTVPEVAAEIKRRNEFWNVKDPTYVIDPSARNQNAINADQVEAAYMREDIYPEWGQNNRPAGILEVRRRLAQKPDSGLLFTRDCPEVIKQTAKYARDPKAADEWKAVPQTERTRHDLVDGVRYVVMSRTYFDPEKEPERTAFQPNYQRPYREERELFPEPAPPMGAFT